MSQLLEATANNAPVTNGGNNAEPSAGTETTPDYPQTQKETRPEIKDLTTLRLFHDPPGTLRLTIERPDENGWGGYSYAVVKLYQAVPLSAPGRYIALQDGKGEEIVMADRLNEFTPETRMVAEEEIRRRYLTAQIKAIPHIKTEFGITYWHVLTDKGERDFVVQSLSESCVWFSDTHILLVDVDGNRFEIIDRNALDPHSREQLSTVL